MILVDNCKQFWEYIETSSTAHVNDVKVNMNEGQEIQLSLHGLAHDGRAVGRHTDGLVVFVEGGLPGQTVLCRLSNIKKNMADAELSLVLEAGTNERPAPCPHAAECGGCPLQALKYPAQLVWKTQLLRDALLRIGHLILPESKFLPIQAISSPESGEWGYRNKMEFTFGRDELGMPRLGLLRRSSHHVVEITGCLLQTSRTMRVLADIRRFVERYGQTALAETLRFAIIREPLQQREQAGNTQCLVEIITASLQREQSIILADLGKYLLAESEVSGFVHSVRRSSTSVAYGEKTILSLGRASLSESLLLDGHPALLTFELGVQSFFQINTPMAEKLYNTAISWVQQYGGQNGLGSGESCWDVYCGVGGLGLALAPLFASILGLDNTPQAIELARKNARAFPDCRFEIANAGKLEAFFRLYGVPAVLCANPPRKGLEKKALEAVLRHAPRFLLLISCDPSSLARDLALLSAHYDIQAVQPLDLFPQTPHIETLVWLTAR